MKKFLTLFSIVFLALASPLAVTSCSTAPSARVVQVQTLKAVGEAADASVSLSAQLYASNKITAAQARQVLDFYNQRFQPVYRLAVAAVNANLDSVAAPDVLALATQLASLVTQFQSAPPPSP